MTADQIRQSFVAPELAHLEKDGGLPPDRSAALASWETAAQLAEMNDRLQQINNALSR